MLDLEKNRSERMRSASRRSIILSISLGKSTWVLVSLFKALFVISCFVLKSNTMPSYNASFAKISFELITIHDKPDGVIGDDHNRFPYVNNVVNADYSVRLIMYGDKLERYFCERSII